MVSSKKSSKNSQPKEFPSTSTPIKKEAEPKNVQSYQLETQIQAVNEQSNLFAIIKDKSDKADQTLSIYSIHDHQLLIHTQLNNTDSKVSFIKWVDLLNGGNFNNKNPSTTSSSSILSVPTNQLILLGKQNGEIDLFDLKSKEISLTLKGEHKTQLIQILQEKDELISLDMDNTIVHWSLQTGKCLKNWKSDDNKKINQILYFSQSKKLLTVGESIKLWDMETYSVIKTFTGVEESIDLVSSFTRDRRLFITYSNSSKSLHLFDIDSKLTTPLFKIQSSENLVKILAIKDQSGLQILTLTNKGTIVGWLNAIPNNVLHSQAAIDLTKSVPCNYKLQFNLDSSEEILPIKFIGINSLYNIPIISRGYSNRLGGFESLWVDYSIGKGQNHKLSRGKSDNLSIDKLSTKRKLNQLEANSTTVDGLDPIQIYTSFPHSLAVEMIQYLNSGKLPTKTLVNLISQTIKYNQLELISLHLTHIGIHQLIKILPHTSPDYIPKLFDSLMELLNNSRVLGGRSLSLLRALLVYHRNTLMSNGKIIDQLSNILKETTGSQLDEYTNLTRLEGRLRHIQQQIRLREKVENKGDESNQDNTEEQDESSAPEDVLSSKESAFEQGYSAFEDSDEDSGAEEEEETFFGIPDDDLIDEEENNSQLEDQVTPTTTSNNTPSKKQKK